MCIRDRDEWFVPRAETKSLDVLRRDCFRAWPNLEATATAKKVNLTTYEFTSEEPFTFTLWLAQRDKKIERIVLNILDDESFKNFHPDPPANQAVAYFCPRGAGPTGWTNLSTNKQTHLRRRLLLLGESLESGQVWDIRQAVAALRSLPGFAKMPVTLRAQKIMAANALYASLFISNAPQLDLQNLPDSHRTGPIYLNILRHLDIPQARALTGTRQ